ncbi:MAG: hypothetical protein R6X02_00715 [Enhygromyxa sp.]
MAEIPVEEIEVPVAPPGSRVVDATGRPWLGADPLELRAAGDYYYRTGELTRAREFYAGCSGAAEGELRAACQWAIGATFVAAARQQAVEDLRYEQELGLAPRPPGPRECTPAFETFQFALSMLRIAQRSHSTARRALVIAALYEELGSDAEALSFYEQALILAPDDPKLPAAIARLRSREPRPRSECRPRDCPSLPFGWHRRSGEYEILGSELEGSSRERVFACFGKPANFSRDTWSYWQVSCTQGVVTTVRLHFAADTVVRVTHERTPRTRDCGAPVEGIRLLRASFGHFNGA